MWTIVVVAVLLFGFKSALTFDIHSLKLLKLSTLSSLTPIPVEVIERPSDALKTTVNQFDGIVPPAPALLEPVTTISSLNGGGNLAVLLWSYVLYQGLLTTSGRPAEWVLPLFVTIFQQQEEQWYLDYQEGYSFTVPPLIEASRCFFFVVLGYYISSTLIASLDGDAFWGWATSGALSIPASLIMFARPKRTSRSVAELEVKMRLDFKKFGDERLTRIVEDNATLKQNIKQLDKATFNSNGRIDMSKENNCAKESSIILAFRRSFKDYRDETLISDKMIKRVCRQYLGYKPLNGYYLSLQLSNLRRESRNQNKILVEEAKKLREEYELELKEQQEGELTSVGTGGDEFMR